MKQNYFKESEYIENMGEEKFWDEYLDKQLHHLVLEYSFDFKRIAHTLKNMKYKSTDLYINQEKCQSRWAFLHLKRKTQGKSEEKKVTASEKFNNLMAKTTKKEDFNVFDYKSVDTSNIPSGNKYKYINKIIFFNQLLYIVSYIFEYVQLFFDFFLMIFIISSRIQYFER